MRIMAHNRKILEKMKPEEKQRKCNCRKKDECPVNGECLATNLIYRATVTTKEETKYYIGSTGNSFKERYNQHKASFNSKNQKKEHQLDLRNTSTK